MRLQILFFVISAFIYAKTDDAFENSSDLCTKRCQCNASSDNQTLRINCVDRGMRHTIANWPEHPRMLMATFSNNRIATLRKMPGSSADDIKLVFSNCSIKYLESGLFESAVNVKYLDLNHNLIESEQLSSDVFKGPYNDTMYQPIALEYLDLSYNQLHSLQKKVFEHTPYLKHLNLEGNGLRVIDRVSCLALAKATQLHFLNLANNRLTELPGDAIKHFPNLTELNLARNELDFVPSTLGYVAASLQILNVSENPIIEFDHTTFEGMENLQELFSSNLYKLSKVYASSFTPLKQLKVLMLSHNKQLREIDEDAFGGMEELEEVYLNDNSLAMLSSKLLPWYQLKVLNINNNQLICDCELSNITAKLPDTIKINQNGPYCLDPRSYISTEMYSLTNGTCSFKVLSGRRQGSPYIRENLRIMRITLTILIVVLVLASSVAIWLGYSKWKTYQRSMHYPFPHQIVYSPIATEFSRF